MAYETRPLLFLTYKNENCISTAWIQYSRYFNRSNLSCHSYYSVNVYGLRYMHAFCNNNNSQNFEVVKAKNTRACKEKRVLSNTSSCLITCTGNKS